MTCPPSLEPWPHQVPSKAKLAKFHIHHKCQKQIRLGSRNNAELMGVLFSSRLEQHCVKPKSSSRQPVYRINEKNFLALTFFFTVSFIIHSLYCWTIKLTLHQGSFGWWCSGTGLKERSSSEVYFMAPWGNIFQRAKGKGLPIWIVFQPHSQEGLFSPLIFPSLFFGS